MTDQEVISQIGNIDLSYIKDRILPLASDKRLKYLDRFMENFPNIFNVSILFSPSSPQGKKANDLKNSIKDYSVMIQELYAFDKETRVIPEKSYDTLGKSLGACIDELEKHFEKELEINKKYSGDEKEYETIKLRNTIFHKLYGSDLSFEETDIYLKGVFPDGNKRRTYIKERIKEPILKLQNSSDGLALNPCFKKQINDLSDKCVYLLEKNKVKENCKISTDGQVDFLLLISGLNLIEANRLGEIFVRDKNIDFKGISNGLITYLRQGDHTTDSICNEYENDDYCGMIPVSIDKIEEWAKRQSWYEGGIGFNIVKDILNQLSLFEKTKDDKWQLIWPELCEQEDDKFRRIVRILYENGKGMSTSEVIAEYNKRCNIYIKYNIPRYSDDKITVRKKRFPMIVKINNHLYFNDDRTTNARTVIYNFMNDDHLPHTESEIINHCRRNGVTVSENSIKHSYIPQICSKGIWPDGTERIILKRDRNHYPDVVFRQEKNKREDILSYVFNYLESNNCDARFCDIIKYLKESLNISITPTALSKMISAFNGTFSSYRDETNKRNSRVKLLTKEKPDFAEGKGQRNIPYIQQVTDEAIKILRTENVMPLKDLTQRLKVLVPDYIRDKESSVRTILHKDSRFSVERQPNRTSIISLRRDI